MTPLLIGTVAIFECDSEYYLNGGADTLICQVDDQADTKGAWSGPEPTCEPFKCLDLDRPTNGDVQYSIEPLLIGTVAMFSCESGFFLSGDTTLTCLNDNQAQTGGTWAGSEPTCEPFQCPALTAPMNGSVFYSTDSPFNVGTVATFTCNPGFSLNGALATLTCGDGYDTEGIWDETEPTCLPFQCPALTVPMNGSVSYSTDTTSPFDVGTVATFTCDPGFSLNGAPSTLNCGDGYQTDTDGRWLYTQGYWDRTNPTCSSFQCPALTTPMDGYVSYTTDTTSPFDVGTTATFTCNSGFSLNGATSTLNCGDGDQTDTDGHWDRSEPTCQPFQCPALTVLTDAIISYSTDTTSPFDVDTVATFMCNPGFSLNGAPNTLTCGDGDQTDTAGHWEGASPTCEPFQCPSLTAPVYGSVLYSTSTTALFSVNTVATFECDPGFSLNGASSTLTCGDGDQTDTVGHWSGTEPSCQSFQCPSLTVPMDGSVLYSTDTTSPFSIGTVATFSCDSGFSLGRAIHTLKCVDGDQSDTEGHWDGTQPTCQRFQCPTLTAQTNATISYSTTSPFDVGTVATFTCNSGFSLNGAPRTLTCGDGDQTNTVGHWEGTMPTCQPFQCPALTAPTEGSISYSNSPFDVGTVATFTCDPGFSLNGAPNTLNCRDGGQIDTVGRWSGTGPSCQPFQCPSLTVLMDGSVSYSTDTTSPFNIGTVATFSCDSGFSLGRAVHTLKCVDGDQYDTEGHWDGTQPTCQRFQCPALTAQTNANISYSTTSPFNIGTVATFMCNAGFTLNGATSTLTCGDGDQTDTDGHWKGTMPTCQPFQCPALTAPTEGYISYSNDITSPFDTGTVATFMCNPGFSLSGVTSTLNCGDGDQTDTVGHWEGIEPTRTCLPFQCPFLTVPMNGSVSYSTDTTSPFSIGTIATFFCNSGFSLNGAPSTLMCGNGDQSDTVGHWNGSEPACEIYKCPSGQDPVWKIAWPETVQNTTSTQMCSEQNLTTERLSGKATRYCDSIGVWSEPNVLECSELNFVDIRNQSFKVFNSNASALELVEQTTGLINRLAGATEVSEVSLLPSSISITNEVLTKVIDVLETAENTTLEANKLVVDVMNNLLDKSNSKGWKDLRNANMNGSQVLLNNAERIGLLLAQTQNRNNGSYVPIQISKANIAILAKQYDIGEEIEFEKLRFYQEENLTNYDTQSAPASVQIPPEFLSERLNLTNSTAIPVVFIIFQNLASFLPAFTNGLSNNTRGVSVVISSQVGERKTTNASQVLQDLPISLNFSFILEHISEIEEYRCVFWNFSQPVGNGGWISTGVSTVGNTTTGSLTTVQCTSTHLTSFAVLVDVAGALQNLSRPAEAEALKVVSYIGCAISVVCLIITVIYFALQRKKLFQHVNHFVHLNLAISLLLAYLVFMIGVETASENKHACAFVATLLHYLFLCVFCWMLCEGVMLYLMLVVVFSRLAKAWWFFLLLGYLLPLPFVLITLAARSQQYSGLKFCWLPTEKGTIFGFVVPMILIILINLIFMGFAIRAVWKNKSISQKSKEGGKAYNSLQLAKSLLLATVILQPILGITWVFGLLTVNSNTTVFAWIFTILNTLQGAAILVFYVLRNEKVQNNIKMCYRSWKKHPYFSRILSVNCTLCCHPQKQQSHENVDSNVFGDTKMSTLKSYVDTLRSHMDTLRSNGGTLKSDGGTLKGHVDTLKSYMDTLRRDGGTLRSDWGTLRRDGGTMRRDGGILRSDGGTLRRDGGTLRRDGGTLRRDGGTLRSTLSREKPGHDHRVP